MLTTFFSFFFFFTCIVSFKIFVHLTIVYQERDGTDILSIQSDPPNKHQNLTLKGCSLQIVCLVVVYFLHQLPDIPYREYLESKCFSDKPFRMNIYKLRKRHRCSSNISGCGEPYSVRCVFMWQSAWFSDRISKLKRGPCCSVVGCSLGPGTNLFSEIEVHWFPKDKAQQTAWIAAVKREERCLDTHYPKDL